jgi:MraZ protein
MASMLRGNALAKLDGKGRLKLPSTFRAVIEPLYGSEFYVTSVRGESVRIYPVEVFAEIEEKLKTSRFKPLVTRLRTALSYYGQRAVMDGQGRILIHQLLREKAGIDGEVAVIGQQDHLELWNRAELENRVEQHPLTDEELDELSSLGL